MGYVVLSCILVFMVVLFCHVVRGYSVQVADYRKRVERLVSENEALRKTVVSMQKMQNAKPADVVGDIVDKLHKYAKNNSSATSSRCLHGGRETESNL